jgi:hypothetical protein
MLTILVVNMNIFITHIYDITMILKNHMFNMHLTIYFLNASKNYKLFFFFTKQGSNRWNIGLFSSSS